MASTRLKILVVGDTNCGKTSLLCVFSNNEALQEYTPIAPDFKVVNIEVDGNHVALSLWNTAGQEEYDSLRRLSYPNTDVVLMCFSLDNPESLENIQNIWMPEVQHVLPTVPIVLVGNKKDMTYTDPYLTDTYIELVNSEDGRAMAAKFGAYAYLECSAKLNIGVQEVFQMAARATLKTKKKNSGCCIVQ